MILADLVLCTVRTQSDKVVVGMGIPLGYQRKAYFLQPGFLPYFVTSSPIGGTASKTHDVAALLGDS